MTNTPRVVAAALRRGVLRYRAVRVHLARSSLVEIEADPETDGQPREYPDPSPQNSQSFSWNGGKASLIGAPVSMANLPIQEFSLGTWAESRFWIPAQLFLIHSHQAVTSRLGRNT